MKTTTQFATVTKIAALCLLALPAAARAQSPSLENLVRLSKRLDTAQAASAELARLQRQSPTDARVPYVYSLVLIERLDHVAAHRHIKQAVQLDPGNLNAWKTRIWLSLSVKDTDDALASMEQLAVRMPTGPVSPAAEQLCQQFSGFMGKAFGYLAGPQAERVATMQVAAVERRILNRLTPSRKAVFMQGRDEVTEEFESRIAEVAQSRQIAVQRETRARQEKLDDLAEEHNYAFGELEKIEGLRLAGRRIAADERNVIAATREHSLGGSAHGAATNYRDSIEQGPTYHRPPNAEADAPYQFDHNYDRYRLYNSRRGGASGYATDRGLDDRHYVDVNRRDAQYHNYLAGREKKMHRRLQRIAKDQAKQLKAPNGGSNAMVRALTAQAQALTTYIELPVTPRAEIASILATT